MCLFWLAGKTCGFFPQQGWQSVRQDISLLASCRLVWGSEQQRVNFLHQEGYVTACFVCLTGCKITQNVINVPFVFSGNVDIGLSKVIFFIYFFLFLERCIVWLCCMLQTHPRNHIQLRQTSWTAQLIYNLERTGLTAIHFHSKL